MVFINHAANQNSWSPNKVLQPTQRSNIDGSPIKLRVATSARTRDNQDLDILARELNVSPTRTNQAIKPLSSAFGSPSATVSSFKSSPRASMQNRTPSRTTLGEDNGVDNDNDNNDDDETPSWAKGNYRDALRKSPRKSDSLAKHLDFTSNRPILGSPRHEKGYEYLCRIHAIKIWLQSVLREEISQSPVELITYIRNGIHLAKLANAILPTQRNVFMNDDRLQFKHTENINRFFHLLDFLSIPDLFRFELTDLYDAKNVPKVWFCLHALSYILHKSDPSSPKMGDYLNKISFSDSDISTANRALTSAPLPNFASASCGDEEDNAFMEKVSSPVKVQNKTIFEKKSSSPFWDPPASEARCVAEREPSKLARESTTFLRPTAAPSQQPQQPHSPPSSYSSYSSQSFQKNFQDAGYSSSLEPVAVHVIKLQSLVRGANFRYSMFVDRIILRSYEEELTAFASIIRGNRARSKTVHKHRDVLRYYDSEIIELQSIIRRKQFSYKKPDLDDTNFNDICCFQSILRGRILRSRVASMKEAMETSSMTKLQAIARMKLVYGKASVVIQNKDLIVSSLIGLQSIARSKLYLKYSTVDIDTDDVGGIVTLQSIIRRNNLIEEINCKHAVVRSRRKQIVELQSIARAGIARSRLCNNVLITLIHEDDVLNDLYAIVRGQNLRSKIAKLKYELKAQERRSILPVQSLFRGILCRYERDTKLDDAYLHVDSLIRLQSKIRAYKVRKNFIDFRDYYEHHVDLVIKSQAVIRRILAQTAYKSLTTTSHPTLEVIRKFAHLLADSDRDFEEEMELNGAKDKIIEKSKINEDLESQIENIDLKLTLLDKNKITVDEFTTSKGPKKFCAINGGVDSLSKLNKSSRTRVELYQRLLYLLQTKPDYWSKLFETFAPEYKTTQKYQDLFNSIVQLFPSKATAISELSREEYYNMKLIVSIMRNDARHAHGLSDITKSHYTFWTEFLAHYNNHTLQRQHLKSMFGGAIIRTIHDEHLDFESDPTIIYASIIENEIKFEGSSSRPRNLTPQEAIKVPDVSSKFVRNLSSLRDCCHEFVNLTEQKLDKQSIPVHIRLLCREAYLLSKDYFIDKAQHQHLAVAGVIFFKHYVGAILSIPENYGIQTRKFAKATANLRHLHRALLQLFSMNTFTDNFMKPLNDFILSMMDPIQALIKKLIAVGTFEDVYNISEYEDMLTTEKPQLTMQINSTICLEKHVQSNIDVMVPNGGGGGGGGGDDELARLSGELSNLMSSSSDLIALTDLSSLTITLDTRAKEESMSDTKVRTLFSQAKRCLLYIIRVQEGNDVLELLISGIKPIHEQKYREIIFSEKEEKRQKPYVKTSLSNSESISFHELKKKCLESILKLEMMGELTRKNSFQELLNQISTDIRRKDSQRLQRSEQLRVLSQAIGKLSDKEMFLRKQLREYKDHVDSVLANLQVKPKSKKLFNIVPVFSKQYFYHRELRRRNRVPAFGSYIVTAKKLMDQKILLNHTLDIPRNKLELMFSCHQVGKFTVEAAKGQVVGASCIITLDDLLALQYENQERLKVCQGTMIFDSQNLIAFIFKTFYDVKKD
ncbi:uncharacterized protein LODBEIA_P59390 [Lodderomyces beijingensis]|uniref:Calponin-homology (CH) domain-containing protein n=1 Tax=Lodderomyces beijingensis TaxID=1775926 RepID=A0ABP0ZXB8_9ASCO